MIKEWLIVYAENVVGWFSAVPCIVCFGAGVYYGPPWVMGVAIAYGSCAPLYLLFMKWVEKNGRKSKTT